MTEYHVYFETTASTPPITVDADDPDEAIEKASENLVSPGGSICHHCSRHFDMAGGWEPTVVEDADGKAVWEYRR